MFYIYTEHRVRNNANPCVRDMSKSLRTCQMSVHGYPVDMSIFCNLQLGLLELQEETPQADINQDNVSLAGVLQGAVGRAVDTPVFALLLDDNTRFLHDRRWDGACSRDASGHRFPNPSASRARRFCSSWNRLLCTMLVMFLTARCWLVGAFSVHIQPQNELRESHTGADVTLSDIRLAVERLWHFLLYGLHLQRAPK